MWYVLASANGITSTFGRFRPERYTFGFTPSVSTSTFLSATSSRARSAVICAVRGASHVKTSITCTASSRARALKALRRASWRICRGSPKS